MIKRTKKDEKELTETMNDLDAISEESEETAYDETAYLPVFNKKRGTFDMFLIRINTATKKAFIEVEATRYDSEMRAHLDMMTRMADDSKAKTKKRRNK